MMACLIAGRLGCGGGPAILFFPLACLRRRDCRKTKAIIDTAGYLLLFLPVICWVSYGLWEYWVEAFVNDEHSGQSAWNPLIWPFRLSFFIGFFLLALQGLAELIKCFQFLTGRTTEWDAHNG